jgi:hypothetical protein
MRFVPFVLGHFLRRASFRFAADDVYVDAVADALEYVHVGILALPASLLGRH